MSISNPSIARFRGTWNPVWMDDNDWLQKFKVEKYYEVFQEDVVGDENPCSSTEMLQHHSSEVGRCSPSVPSEQSTVVDDDEYDAVSRLLDLFNFAARAVIQPTPWSTAPLTRKERKAVLGSVLQRFLDRSSNPFFLAKRVKESLRSLQHDDVATDLMCHYTSYTFGASWEPLPPPPAVKGRDEELGRQRVLPRRRTVTLPQQQSSSQQQQQQQRYIDKFRTLENFYNNEVLYNEFRSDCDKKVEERLRMINYDVSRSEARATKAIDQWHSVRSVTGKDQARRCFGNHLTVELRDIVLDGHSLFEAKLSEPGTKKMGGGEDRDGGGEDSSEAITVIDLQRLTKKTSKLPADPDISFFLVNDGAVDVRHGLRGAYAKPLRLENGKHLSWKRTQPVSFYLGSSGGRAVERSVVRMEVRRKAFFFSCAAGDSKLLAEFDIPLLAPLYTDIARFDSQVRAELGDQAGIHAQRVEVTDIARGVRATLDIWMECLELAHNQRPPPLDVELEEERRRRVIQNVRDDVWKVDHHANYVELANILGDLGDTEYLVLNMYADRYLIHEQLEQCTFLVNTALQSDFSQAEDRDAVELAVEEMLHRRGDITNRICAKLVDDALATVRNQSCERLISLEFAVRSPHDAASALQHLSTVLHMTGLIASDHPRVVSEKVAEEMAPFCKKLEKLYRSLAADSPSAGGAGAGASRLSVLPELQRCTPKRDLAVMARIFVQIVQDATEPLHKSIAFAKQARDARVTALICWRLLAACSAVVPHLERCVGMLLQVMTATADSNADPLSDTCGVVICLFEKIMELVVALDNLDSTVLAPASSSLQQLALPFFPLWFYLCKMKQPGWIASLVDQEPLEPVAPRKVVCNHTPGDTRGIVDALLLVFLRVLNWTNPSIAAPFVHSFSKVVAEFVEGVCAALVRKAQEAQFLSEKTVALSSFCKLTEGLEDFWKEIVEGQLVPRVASSTAGSAASASPSNVVGGAARQREGDSLLAQCTAVKVTAMASIVENLDALVHSLAVKLRSNVMEALRLRLDGADDATGAFQDDNMSDLLHDLRYDLVECIGIALDTTVAARISLAPNDEGDEDASPPRNGLRQYRHAALATEVPSVKKRCIQAVYRAFREFALGFAAEGSFITSERKAQLMRTVEMIDRTIREEWVEAKSAMGGGVALATSSHGNTTKLLDEVLATEAHAARSVVLWLCHTSQQIIHVLQSDEAGSAADEVLLETVRRNGEVSLLEEVLRLRTDKDAAKFVAKRLNKSR